MTEREQRNYAVLEKALEKVWDEKADWIREHEFDAAVHEVRREDRYCEHCDHTVAHFILVAPDGAEIEAAEAIAEDE